MDVFNTKLKENYPQKYFLKVICRLVYYMGMGDCWYEKTIRSNTHKIVYSIWAILINTYLILSVVNELCAHFRSDLTFKEKNDLIQFSLAHPSLVAKYVSLIIQRKRVSELFKRLVEESSFKFRSLGMEKKAVKDSIWYFVALGFITYGTLFFTTLDAFSLAKREGVPFRIEVTLLPSRNSSGILTSVAVTLIELHWWLLVTNMILVDAISFISMVYLGYKFKLIVLYFHNLREKTMKNMMDKTKTDKELAKEYEEDFLSGVKQHREALWCSRNVQCSLGTIYGVQIIESITLLAICLIKLVNLERNMTFLVANAFYISCLLILNGAYMMAGGDVTHEASLLPMAMFHSGWELVKTGKQFQTLSVLAIMNSQRPVFMTAFGVISLSHANFISVIRSSYSFFAVMY